MSDTSYDIYMLNYKWDDAFIGLAAVDGADRAVYSADIIAAKVAEEEGITIDAALAGITSTAYENPQVLFAFEMNADQVGLREVVH